MQNPVDPRVIVALDFPQAAAALALVEQLEAGQCRLKVGKELFTRGGPALVEDLQARGFEVFLDLKFHDIPNTVAKACRAAADLGVWMVNVHALGGRKMMEAAREAIATAPHQPRLIAVTILTSMGEADLAEVGLSGTAEENVARLASLAKRAGMDGVVCSPREVVPLRESLGEDFLLVTPGVRPTGSSLDDQNRVATPEAALASGASHLVIGRPITQAASPLAALADINRAILPFVGA